MTTRNLNNKFVERRLRRGSQTLRELCDELRITSEQLEFIEGEAALELGGTEENNTAEETTAENDTETTDTDE